MVVDTATGQLWKGYFSSSVGMTDEGFYGQKTGEKK
jgi:hypothetical protein